MAEKPVDEQSREIDQMEESESAPVVLPSVEGDSAEQIIEPEADVLENLPTTESVSDDQPTGEEAGGSLQTEEPSSEIAEEKPDGDNIPDGAVLDEANPVEANPVEANPEETNPEEVNPDDANLDEANPANPDEVDADDAPTATEEDVPTAMEEDVPTAMEEDVPAVNKEDDYIKITVTSQRDEKVISIDPNASVHQLRILVGMKFNIILDQVCLIFGGRLLCDDESLAILDVTDGTSMHLIVRHAPLQGGQAADFTQASSPITGPTQFSRLGLGAGDFVQLQQQMQKQMMANPEMVRQMISNPLVQQLMANPTVMKDMIMYVPQTREMLEKNPDIADMLNNPDIMKQTLEIAKNPDTLQDLLSKMEKTEPTGDAASGQTGPGVQMPSIPSSQTMLRLMSQNPQMLQQLLQAPYLPTMMEGLAANPQWAQQMISQNPLFASNPQLQQQMNLMMPYYLQQMQNPEISALMKNPKALQAMLRIQHGVDVLQSEAPSLAENIGLPYLSMPSQLGMHAASAPCPSGDPGAAGGFPGTMHYNQPDPMSIMMSQMVQQMAQDKLGQPADQRYMDQLDLMSTMGFLDRQENLKILVSTFGDVDAAVSRLLQQQQE